MEERRLGASGLKVSEVGLGCNNFGMRISQEETNLVVHAALDAGVTLFDTADIYGATQSEVMLGNALKGRRSEAIVATKFGMAIGGRADMKGGSRRYIMNAVEASLTRLQTDYIDLYQMHQPDEETPVEETLRALDDIVRQGKVRYLGNSNFTGWQIADADWIARSARQNRFISAQNNYSLLERSVEKEVLGACERFGLGFLPFFPLASGLLTGKYKRGEAPPEGTRLAAWGRRGQAALNDGNFDRLDKLSAFASDHDKTLLDLAIAWLLGRRVVSSVIAGATRPEQVTANAHAASWRLTPEQVADIDALAA